MHKTIIFDFFEVIHQDPLEIMLKRKGIKREGRFQDACLRLDTGAIGYQRYLDELAEAFDYNSLVEFQREFDNIATVDTEVVKIIQDLRSQGHQTALLSNTHSDEIEPLLTRHSLHRLFDDIIISSEVGIAKPDAAIFQLTLARLKAKPEQTLFTDDNPKNVKAAASVGITDIWFTGARTLRQELRDLGLLRSPVRM